jgi:hypothetical protein
MVESFEFGKITIDGNTYRRDLKIVDGKIVPGWWRAEGHEIAPSDIKDILDARPEVLVVGMGDPGRMRVLPETEARLKSLGIRLIAEPTAEAVKTYNRLSGTLPTAFAAHLTC